jgi:hypothetical protein
VVGSHCSFADSVVSEVCYDDGLNGDNGQWQWTIQESVILAWLQCFRL